MGSTKLSKLFPIGCSSWAYPKFFEITPLILHPGFLWVFQALPRGCSSWAISKVPLSSSWAYLIELSKLSFIGALSFFWASSWILLTKLNHKQRVWLFSCFWQVSTMIVEKYSFLFLKKKIIGRNKSLLLLLLLFCSS